MFIYLICGYFLKDNWEILHQGAQEFAQRVLGLEYNCDSCQPTI